MLFSDIFTCIVPKLVARNRMILIYILCMLYLLRTKYNTKNLILILKSN